MSTATNSTYEAAHGRWREILLASGVPVAVLNRKQQACPMCGGEDRFQFTDRSLEGDYICRGCGAGKGMQLLMHITGMAFPEAARKVDEIVGHLPPAKRTVAPPKRAASREVLNKLWQEGKEITAEDPAGLYMASRKLTFAGLRKVLRFVPSLIYYQDQSRHPGIIALFRDADGNAKQIQRTYLTDQGTKADLDPNRMFMPGDMPSGGAIRLGDEAESMGVCEGVETAIAASQRFSMPVWATTSEVLLQRWMPPPVAKKITVFGDNDANFVGQHAAYALAKRLVHEARKAKIERDVEVMIPSTTGNDWADEQ